MKTPNIDGLDDGTVGRLSTALRRKARLLAMSWWPDRTDEERSLVTGPVRLYCTALLKARTARATGRIDDARTDEHYAERQYQSLPQWAKW